MERNPEDHPVQVLGDILTGYNFSWKIFLELNTKTFMFSHTYTPHKHTYIHTSNNYLYTLAAPHRNAQILGSKIWCAFTFEEMFFKQNTWCRGSWCSCGVLKQEERYRLKMRSYHEELRIGPLLCIQALTLQQRKDEWINRWMLCFALLTDAVISVSWWQHFNNDVFPF